MQAFSAEEAITYIVQLPINHNETRPFCRRGAYPDRGSVQWGVGQLSSETRLKNSGTSPYLRARQFNAHNQPLPLFL